MSPNCQSCDEGGHDACDEDWCECGKRGHSDQTVETHPLTAWFLEVGTQMSNEDYERGMTLVAEAVACLEATARLGLAIETEVSDGHSEQTPLLREGQCEAALNLKGEHFACDLDKDHDGLAHTSTGAQAIWSPVPDRELIPRMTIPLYALLDLYMALGFDSANFDAEYDQRGYADMWAWLLHRVRDDKRRPGHDVTQNATQNATHLARSYPALIEAAQRGIKGANITGLSVSYDQENNVAYYTFNVEG